MPIEPEVMRSCLLEALRRNSHSQYENLKSEVAVVAKERGLPVQAYAGHVPLLELSDFRRLRETVWRLVAEGVMTIGIDDRNSAWPWLSLTEYGEAYVKDQRATPYELAEYMARATAAGQLDPVEEVYVREALEAFRRNLPNAAAVMIGAASEQLLILTVQDIAAKDSAASSDAQKAVAGTALKMLRYAQAYFTDRKATLPRDLSEQLDTTLSGIASLIRVTRNDGGHPALPSVDRDRCFVALQLYPDYRSWLIRSRSLLPL